MGRASATRTLALAAVLAAAGIALLGTWSAMPGRPSLALAPALAPPRASQAWNVTWNDSLHDGPLGPNASGGANGTYRFSLGIQATNTSTTAVMVEAVEQLTEGGSFWFPTPNGTFWENSSTTMLERSFFNLTTLGTVTGNGSSHAALGLLDGSTNTTQRVELRLGGSPTPGANANLWANSSGALAATYAGPLGLVPWSTSGLSTWNSTANVTVSGSIQLEENGSLLPGTNGSSGPPNGSAGGGTPITAGPLPPPPPHDGSSGVGGNGSPPLGLFGAGGCGFAIPGSGPFLNGSGAPPPVDARGAGAGGVSQDPRLVFPVAHGTACVFATTLVPNGTPFNGNLSGILLDLYAPVAPDPVLLQQLLDSDLFGGAGHGVELFGGDPTALYGGGAGWAPLGSPPLGGAGAGSSGMPPPAGANPPATMVRVDPASASAPAPSRPVEPLLLGLGVVGTAAVLLGALALRRDPRR